MNVLWRGLLFLLLGSSFLYLYIILSSVAPTQRQVSSSSRVSSSDSAVHTSELRNRFFEQGVIGPFNILSKSEADSFLAKGVPAPGLDWANAYFLRYPHIYNLATDPRILALVKELLGEEILLIGTEYLKRPENSTHRWHCDTKTVKCNTSAAVWVALANVTEDTSLKIITHSHKVGTAAQEIVVGGLPGPRKGGSTLFYEQEESALKFIRKEQPQAQSRVFPMDDGNAIVFHGKVWHGSWNPTNMQRHSFLLQYITPDCPSEAYISYDFPLVSTNVLFPTVVVSGNLGQHKHTHNLMKIESTGTGLVAKHRYKEEQAYRGQRIQLNSTRQVLTKAAVLHFSPESSTNEGLTQRPLRLLNQIVASTTLVNFSAYHSTLLQYRTPHEPLAYPDDQLILILDGRARITRLVDSKVQPFPEETFVYPGDIIYHPKNCPHTITSLHSPSTTYLTIQLSSHSSSPVLSALNTKTLLQPKIIARPMNTGIFLDGSITGHLKLSGQIVKLDPGVELKPHTSSADRLIIVESGQLMFSPSNTLLERGDLLFCPANVACGLANVGAKESRHIIFEFKGKYI